MLFSKNSGKFPDPFEKNTSNNAYNTVAIHKGFSTITPVQPSSAKSNGDIYYSTFLRFVKPISEDFSKILRTDLPRMIRIKLYFEENTGLLEDRYHIKYTHIAPLSSQHRKKVQKKRISR